MNDNEIINHQQKDTSLRQALAHREGRRPVMPSDLNERVMARMADDGRRKRVVRRWIAAAACLLVVAGIGVTLMYDKNGGCVDQVTAKVENVNTPNPSTTIEEKGEAATPTSIKEENSNAPSGFSENEIGHSENASFPDKVLKEESSPNPSSINEREVINPENGRKQEYEIPVTTPFSTTKGEVGYLRYASATKNDSVAYRAPSLFDDFIAKMADYNGVERVSLDCEDIRDGGIVNGNGKKSKGTVGRDGKENNNRTKVISAAYVFTENNEVDVFGRLLQMACWYDNKSPGYLLNISRQQFFFCLNDERKGEKYLWTAERIDGNRILVFCTHSPMEVSVSSACYQEYKEHLNIRTLKN